MFFLIKNRPILKKVRIKFFFIKNQPLLGEITNTIKKNPEAVKGANREANLEENTEKTKYMVVWTP